MSSVDVAGPARAGLAWILAVLWWTPVGAKEAPAFLEGRGLANASAAVRVGDDQILVGSDENNALLLYRASVGGEPLKVFATSRWLDLASSPGEVDFEGAARVGDVLYWIGSHARNKNGKYRPERHRLLALRLTGDKGEVELTPVARPVTTLLDDLASVPALAPFHLGEAAQMAPESPGGLNIEGLAATPDNGLWIAFRSPVPNERALLVPLSNPAEWVAGGRGSWGDPVQLDLGGAGVRDMVWTGREYFILGGNSGDGGKTRLFRWAGPGAEPVLLKVPGLKDLNPEALVAFGTPEKPRLLILSDDGNRKSNDTRNPAQRSFRMLWVDPVPQ